MWNHRRRNGVFNEPDKCVHFCLRLEASVAANGTVASLVRTQGPTVRVSIWSYSSRWAAAYTSCFRRLRVAPYLVWCDCIEATHRTHKVAAQLSSREK